MIIALVKPNDDILPLRTVYKGVDCTKEKNPPYNVVFPSQCARLLIEYQERVCPSSGSEPVGAVEKILLMAYRFEFDPVNKILLFRFEGRLTDGSLAESYRAIRKYSTATDASVGIWDLSSVTEFAVSNEFIRQLADQEPAMADATTRPRIIVAPAPVGFGLSRMFQLMGEPTRPLLNVVRTLDEALAALDIQSPTSNL